MAGAARTSVKSTGASAALPNSLGLQRPPSPTGPAYQHLLTGKEWKGETCIIYLILKVKIYPPA